MTWITGLAVYVVLWWLVIFMVLPWGNRQIDSDDVAQGQAYGAPKKPRLLIKMAVTTVIAAIIWAIAYLVIESGWITFRG